jgi:signal transduction histidine kinase
LKISVIDSGLGIDKNDQSKLFKQFGFLENTRKQNSSGIGLGLMISDQISQNFGSKITFESELGVGSTFSFTFKLDNLKDIDYEST